MRHPSEIFKPVESERIRIEAHSINDLKSWRDGDIVDLLLDMLRIMQDDEWKSQNMLDAVLSRSIELRLPSSITTLMLNTIPRLKQAIDRTANEPMSLIDVQLTKGLIDVKQLAVELGMSEIIAKQLPQNETQETSHSAVVAPPSPTEQHRATNQEEFSYAPTSATALPVHLAITTNQSGDHGRQWKIGGQLIAEVVFIEGIGFIGRRYSGDERIDTRPYREASSPMQQCRAYTEGILKLVRTLPR